MAKDIIKSIKSKIDEFDWTGRRGDALRKLYQDMILPERRKIYGEFYTPDWLAEKLCHEVIDEDYIEKQLGKFNENQGKNGNKDDIMGILDPACGSGTFLYHAINRLLTSTAVSNACMEPGKVAEFICRMVHGIDIHPIAVEMSAANMYRALHGVMPVSKFRIYQGDALLSNKLEGTLTYDIYQRKVMEVKSPKGMVMTLPYAFLEKDEALRWFVRSARTQISMPHGLDSVLDNETDKKILETAYDTMREIIEAEGNGIWAWYVKNQAGPMRLADKKNIGRIVANPPWVRFKELKGEVRQKDVKEMAEKGKIWVGGAQAANFDIASLFVTRCTSAYLSKTGHSGWVLPIGAIIAEREWGIIRKSIKDNLTKWNWGKYPFPEQSHSGIWIVSDKKGSFQMIHRKGFSLPKNGDHWIGNVEHKFYAEEVDGPELPEIGEQSDPYSVRKGATIIPHSLVRIDKITDYNKKTNTVSFTTVKSTKDPWDKVPAQEGSIPEKWVKNCVFSDGLIQYHLGSFRKYIVPLVNLEWDPRRMTNSYWKTASNVYRSKRGKGASTPETLQDNLDYYHKLTSQLSIKTPFVVYNKSGTSVYAAIVEPGTIVDQTVYRVQCDSREEALFIMAILNAACMQNAYRKASGEASRDNAKYLWEKIPMPRYDKTNSLHAELVLLSKKSIKIAGQAYVDTDTSANARRAVLEALRMGGVSGKIDEVVVKLLPEYVNFGEEAGNKIKQAPPHASKNIMLETVKAKPKTKTAKKRHRSG